MSKPPPQHLVFQPADTGEQSEANYSPEEIQMQISFA
jgi:hypothetical protein